MIPLAIFGARLWTFWFDPTTQQLIQAGSTLGDQVARFFGFIDNTWQLAGLSVHGALLFGGGYLLIVFTFHSKRFQIALGVYWDVVVKAVLIAQIIGRWANFFNQELLGEHYFTTNYPVNFGWIPLWFANYLADANNPAQLYHPLFLYESFAHFWLLILLFTVPALWKVCYTPWSRTSQFGIATAAYQKKLLQKRIFPLYRWYQQQVFKNTQRQLYYQSLLVGRLPSIQMRTTAWNFAWFYPLKNQKYTRWVPLQRQWTGSSSWLERGRIILVNLWKRDSSALTNHFGPWWSHYRVGNHLGWYMLGTGLIRYGLQAMRRADDQMTITLPVTIALVVLGIISLYITQFLAPNRMRSRYWHYEVTY